MKYIKDFLDINEGLIKTHDINLILDTTIERLSLLGLNINGYIKNTKIVIEIDNIKHLSYTYLNNIADVLISNISNTGGYFISYIEAENIHSMKNKLKEDIYELINNKQYYNKFTIVFESKFDEVTQIPKKLYHLSIEEYETKILSKGIFPKSKNKLSQNLDRVYLCLSIEDCVKLVPQMNMYYETERDRNMYVSDKKYNKNTTPIIFEIDTKNIKRLYKDPNYINGYFTVDNIPPNDIITIKDCL